MHVFAGWYVVNSAQLMSHENEAYSVFKHFAKLRSATISFVISVRLSVRMEQPGSHWTDFHEIWYENLLENLSKNSSFIKICQE